MISPLPHLRTRTAARARTRTLPLLSRPAPPRARTLPLLIGGVLAISVTSLLAHVAPAAAARWSTVATLDAPPARAPIGIAAVPDVVAPTPITIQALPARDERMVRVFNVNSGESATFGIGPRGFVRAEALTEVNHFFRCRRTQREHAIAPAVLALLGDIAARWPGRVIEVVSGFRAPPYGAPHSRHFKGHAIDLRVRGVRTSQVRDFVWREHQGVGVGHYAQEDFVHVDARDLADEIAWSAPREDSRPQYNPRWARRARRAPATLALASRQ